MPAAAAEAAAAMQDALVVDDEEIAGLELEADDGLRVVQQRPKRR